MRSTCLALRGPTPGSTLIASGTLDISPSQGLAFLRATAESLLRQGFRRQVYISHGQGIALFAAGTLVREFFDEHYVPSLYIDMDVYLRRLNPPPDSSKSLFGSHHIAGRIIDIPLKTSTARTNRRQRDRFPWTPGSPDYRNWDSPEAMPSDLRVPDVMAHGRPPLLPATAAEREEWGSRERLK